MGYYWKCTYGGSTPVRVRSYAAYDAPIVGSNPYGRIIGADDNGDGWLHQYEYWNSSSKEWVSLEGYTSKQYYETSSNPDSGGSPSPDPDPDPGEGEVWGWGEELCDETIAGNNAWSESYYYSINYKTIAYGYFKSSLPGTITITHNHSQSLDYWLYIGIAGQIALSQSDESFYYVIDGASKLGHGQITYQVAANTRYDFGIARDGASTSGTITIEFTPTVSYFTIQYFLDDPAPRWNYTDHIVGQKATLIDKIPEKSDYIFKGWSKNPGSLSLPTYYSGSSTDITDSAILYTVWWPAFTWKDYTYSEFLTLYNNTMTQYNQPSLAAPIKEAYYQADRVNKLRTTLGLNELIGLKGTRISKAPLNECSTCYNKVNAL